ncbi:MAG: hypothetical protein JW913_02930 [Chitinispirillaceae bacterium]|nr:hypothetical protein [Chitinispirillaceae bacterium]
MKISFLSILIFLLSNGAFAASSASEQKPASWYWQKGLEAARRNASDTALSFLKQSYGRGISDDSLYYLWAETYLYKGDLDTALALNFSVKPSSGNLHKKALEQRYLIYSSLGWRNEAEALRDSLGRRPGMNPRRLMPECNLFLSGGAYLENNASDRHYPYSRASDSSATITDGTGDASLRFGWSIPIGKTQRVQFGARLRYTGSRFSGASSMERFNDSTDISAGGYLRYTLFSDRLALSYTCSQRKDFLDRKLFLHQFSFQYAVLTEHWLGALEAGYNYRLPLPRHYYYVKTFADRLMGRKSDIGFTLLFSGMEADKYVYRNDETYLFFKDGVLYGDSSSTLDTIKNIRDLSGTGRYLIINECSVPQSFQGVYPRIRYEYQFTKKATAGIGGGYLVTWYRGHYSWMDLHWQVKDVPTTGIFTRSSESYLAYDIENKDYHWVDKIPSYDSVILDSRPVSITYHSERRVDQALSLNLFFKYSFGRFGDVTVDFLMERNFSTLMHATPVDIQKWYGEIMLTWFFRFKPDYGPGRK